MWNSWNRIATIRHSILHRKYIFWMQKIRGKYVEYLRASTWRVASSLSLDRHEHHPTVADRLKGRTFSQKRWQIYRVEPPKISHHKMRLGHLIATKFSKSLSLMMLQCTLEADRAKKLILLIITVTLMKVNAHVSIVERTKGKRKTWNYKIVSPRMEWKRSSYTKWEQKTADVDDDNDGMERNNKVTTLKRKFLFERKTKTWNLKNY